MGLVRDAEFGGNCHLVVFVFDLSVSLFWVFRASMGSFFSACVGSRPASNFHPQKYHEFQAPKIYFTRANVYMKISDTPPPGKCSRCPNESDKTGVMKIATKERDIDNDVIVYIVIGDASDSVNKTIIERTALHFRDICISLHSHCVS